MTSEVDRFEEINRLTNKRKFNKALSLLENIVIDNQYTEFKVLLIRISIFRKLDEIETGKEFIDKAMKIANELDNREMKFETLVEHGYLLWKNSEYSSTLSILSEAEDMKDDISIRKNPRLVEVISTIYNVKGLVYLYQGELNQALDNFTKCYEMRVVIEDKNQLAMVLNNIGVTFYNRGELDKSIEYYNESLTLWSELEEYSDIGYSLFSLGLTYYELGEYEFSYKFYSKSLPIWKSSGGPRDISETLFELIRNCITRDKTLKAREFLDELKELAESSTILIVEQWYFLGVALILRTKSRMADKLKAQNFLRQITEKPVVNQRLSIIAMKNLCEFYILEVKLFGSKEALDDALTLVRKLHFVAQEQSSFSLLVEALILNAKLSLIQGNINGCTLILEQAELTAEEKGLHRLQIMVNLEKYALETEVEKWKSLISQNASINEKIEQSRIIEYLQDVQEVMDNNNELD